jgi:hypothetical protein
MQTDTAPAHSPTMPLAVTPAEVAAPGQLEPAPESAMEGAEMPAAGDAGQTDLPRRPDEIPEKFWDPAAGAVRVDVLLRSYQELERRLGRSIPRPEGADDVEGANRLLTLLGRPETAEGYEIEPPHPLIAPDPALNSLLHDAGFTQRQAQLVYQLAAERLLPLLEEAAGELQATRQLDRLQSHFGGSESWRTTAAQIKAYADANLPEELHSALAGSYEGVLALYEMMRKAEPDIVGQAGSGQLGVTEDGLRELIRDPRYWRDRDPEIVQRVTAGYRNLYPS